MWRRRLLAHSSGSDGSGGVRDLAHQLQLARVYTDRAISNAPRAVGLQLAAALGAGSASQAVCAAAGVPSVPTGKPYLAKPTLFDAFAPTQLAMALVLGALQPFVTQMNAATRRASYSRSAGRVKGETHDHDGNPLTPFALINWETLRKDMFFNCVKRLTTNVLLSASQLALWNCLDGADGQRIIAKFLKDLGASAERKSLRVEASSTSNVEAASCMMYTYLRGAVLGWTVYHAVEFCWGCTSLPHARSFPEILRDALRMPIVLCSGACGAAVGTLIWPGHGTRLGALGGELLPDLFCPAVCGAPISDFPRRGEVSRKSGKRRKQK